MALARTWHSVVDIPLDDTSTSDNVTRSAILALKRCLTGDWGHGGTPGANGPPPAAWSLDYSSNAVAAGAADYIHALADVVGSTNAAAARTWMAFSSPSGTRRMLFDFTALSGTARVMATRHAFGLAGMSTSQPPNATDWISAITAPWESSTLNWLTPTVGLHRAAFTMCSEGEHWMFLVYKPSNFPSNVVVSALAIWPIRSRAEIENFDHPWALLLAPTESGRRFTGQLGAWLGTSVSPLGVYLPGGAEPSKAVVAANASAQTDFVGGADGLNGFTGRYDEIQLPVFAIEHPTRRGYLGNLEDLGWTHINMQGTWTPQHSIERVTWGQLLIPFAAAPVL